MALISQELIRINLTKRMWYLPGSLTNFRMVQKGYVFCSELKKEGVL
jgi:hypothetical protein